MSKHVPEQVLREFVEGDVSEELAVHIAEHLDTCQACGARAARLEPLASAFAAVEDPPIPDGLVAAIREHVEAGSPSASPSPALELSLGVSLLVCAVALMVAFGNPLAVAVDLSLVMHALSGLGRGLTFAVGSTTLTLAGTMIFGLLGVAATWRIAKPISPLGRLA
jgi:anti-sigma factor RsiW